MATVFDWALIFDYPNANELRVFMCPMVYWAIKVMLLFIDAVVVEEDTLGHYGSGTPKL